MSINDRALFAEDGTRVAYGVAGTGPALVLSNGLTTSSFFWKYVRPIWLRHHTVVTWDLPGHGASGPAQSEPTAHIQTLPRLLAQIMDELHLPSAVHVGWSTGCQLVLEMYRQFPARCEGLALLLGGAGQVLNTTQLPLPGPVIETLVRVSPPQLFAWTAAALGRAMRLPGSVALGRRFSLIGERADPADMQQVIEHIGSVDGKTLRSMLLSIQSHSAQAVLASLRIPLLIVAGDKDPFAPAEAVGVPLHVAAPNSEFVRLPHGTHTALLEQPELIAQAVETLSARCRGNA